jgi:hypothetical protein
VKPLARPVTLVALALALGLAAPSAQATPATIKRSMENMTLAPLDIALSPVVAGKTIYQNLQDIEDSRAVRIAYPVPGFVWLTTVQIGAGVLRAVTGVFEFIPGLILIPFDTDLDPLFDPATENEALVDVETPVYDLRFGINYTSAPF